MYPYAQSGNVFFLFSAVLIRIRSAVRIRPAALENPEVLGFQGFASFMELFKEVRFLPERIPDSQILMKGSDLCPEKTFLNSTKAETIEEVLTSVFPQIEDRKSVV